MSEKIDPREVLAYLNELGYTNITAHQLKEFIKDLKKIIKCDTRFANAGDPIVGEYDTYLENNDDSCEYLGHKNSEDFGPIKSKTSNKKLGKKHISNSSNNDKENQTDNIQAYSQITQTNGLLDSRRNKHIAVHIYDTKDQKHIDHKHCIHINSLEKVDGVSKKTCSSISSKPEATESKPSSTRELLHSRASRTSSKDRKTKVAFIRPAISKPSINKSDPVALYHYYQSEWKKTKIPGQENRDDLRWAIRERMLSGPKVEVRAKCNIPRCGWSR